MKLTITIAVTMVCALAMSAPSVAGSQTDNAAMVNIQLNDVPVKEAIAKLFEGRNLSYYIEGGAPGKVVELKLKGITFDQALTALTDAADLTYIVDEGTYIIRPASKTVYAAPVARRDSNIAAARPREEPYGEQPYQLPPPQPAPTPAPSVVVSQQASPVYYAQAGGGGYPYGGYGGCGYGGYGGGYGGCGGMYQVGLGVGVLPGGWGGPTFVTGTGPTMLGRAHIAPPPPGWVSPDTLRFLRFNYALPTRPYIGYPVTYGWGW